MRNTYSEREKEKERKGEIRLGGKRAKVRWDSESGLRDIE